MTWTSGIADLRVLLSDGPTDKLRAFKSVFGRQDAINTVFKTFEFRRVTDFSSSATVAPLGIYIDGALAPASAIQSDNPDSGYFVLTTGPTYQQQVQAAYYIQWFTDTEVDGFLVRGSNWLGQDDDYSLTPSGLKTAILKYGASEAYQKLALKYAENITETYQLQDNKDERRMTIVDAYQKASVQALKEAEKYRDDYYGRKGRALAPLFATAQGRVRDVPPNG